MSKKFTFYNDSWWDEGFGCDCCPPSFMEAYNSSDTNCNLGTAHSIEDCYVQAIKTESDVYMEDDSLWELDIHELKMVAEELGVVVEIIS